ncbi:hypothetical protein [Neisseria wadsworthii]|uniref:hypothetical protein n=1 Tax=Neisseria wadsworthii TaxID=607711 RepID=UPI000D315033|nr:hypothetical protein [Neisseria wadsworthii]
MKVKVWLCLAAWVCVPAAAAAVQPSAQSLAGTWVCRHQDVSGKDTAKITNRLKLNADGTSETELLWHFYLTGDTLKYRILSKGSWQVDGQTLVRQETPFSAERGHRADMLKNDNVRKLDRRLFAQMKRETASGQAATAQSKILGFNQYEMKIREGEEMHCYRIDAGAWRPIRGKQ